MDISNDKSAAPAADTARLTAAQKHASARDERWFRENPKAKWRVRPLLEGESHSCDEFIEGGPDLRGYAVVIPHAKLGDSRAADGTVVYPVVTTGRQPKGYMDAEAALMVAGFAKSPDPTPRPPLVVVTISDPAGPLSVGIHIHGKGVFEGQAADLAEVDRLMDKLELDFGARPNLVIARREPAQPGQGGAA